MKNRNKILLSALISLFMTPAFALPSVTVLATGGTIAGGGASSGSSSYQAGKGGADSLVSRL